MEYASLGRQKLEEIRQKRAAERLQKAASGTDTGMHRSQSGNQIPEIDSNGLLSQVRDLENKNTEMKDENQKLLSKLEGKKVENDSLVQRVNNLEENILPSLRKALNDASIEKDAAIVSREDALAQLRTMRKRLKEAEEDQYKAEEDAAALRAELNSLQQQVLSNPYATMHSIDNSSERIRALEKDIMELRSLLQHESLLRQEDQQKLIQERLRASSLMVEKHDLEEKLAALSKKASEEAAEATIEKNFSVKDKEKYEKQLHNMAVMIERLESGRQKLLAEIDSQSSEIERLFEENSTLSASYREAIDTASQWEKQVKDCLKQNEELRHQLDKLRLEQVRFMISSDPDNKPQEQVESGKGIGNLSDLPSSAAENLLLKEQLAKERSRAEALAAEVMKLSAEQNHTVQAYKNITRFYRPVLREIESNLMKMKEDSFVTIE